MPDQADEVVRSLAGQQAPNATGGFQSIINSLLGNGQERFQTWPERMARGALSAPHDAMTNPAPLMSNEALTAQIPGALNMAGLSGTGAIGVPPGALGATGVFRGTPKFPKWTEAETATLKDVVQGGGTPEDVAKALNRPLSTIRERANNAGVELPSNESGNPGFPPTAKSPWGKPENIERLKELHAKGTPYMEIANELGTTKGAIAGKLDRLGLTDPLNVGGDRTSSSVFRPQSQPGRNIPSLPNLNFMNKPFNPNEW